MVRFHDEYHGTSSQPSNFVRTQLFLLDWFSRYRRGGEAAVATPPAAPRGGGRTPAR